MAGVNLTYMLEEVFDLRDKRVGSLIHDRLPGSAAGRSFLSLLAGSSSVFESVSTADSYPLTPLHAHTPSWGVLAPFRLSLVPVLCAACWLQAL